MKKLIRFFICALIAGFVFTGCDTGDGDYENTGDGKTLVCLGDSLTAGYGASQSGLDDPSKSYPAYLQSKVSLPVINAGISGDTAKDALKRIEADVLSKNPGIVIIELGANDLFQALGGMFSGGGTAAAPGTIIPVISEVISATRESLQGIIDKLDDGTRKIYVAKFYTEAVAQGLAQDLAGRFGLPGDMAGPLLAGPYDRMFEDLAESNNIELIHDIWDGVWGIHMSDMVHPNARGYEIMADNYFKALQPCLREHGLLK